MANETFKKRQKEAARREKQTRKAARRMERRNDRAGAETKPQEENPHTAESLSEPAPKLLS
ncbi:MAG TPA: hypothetical protein VGR30_05555 [Candidatus Binatia bacterium]|jgi:hypothetical protein|nr:hypothetical protein [Candidatus Binatia bacterium]